MRRLICLVTLCLFVATVFSGCGMLKKLGFGKDSGNLTPASSIAIGEEDAKALSGKVPIHLYFADTDNEKLRLEVRYIPISEAAKSVSNLASIIVQELVKGPAEAGLQPTIPTGTRLLPPVSINSGVATVNLSKEFVSNHPGGKAAEQMTIYSVVDSLTELKDVSRVSFLIEGKVRKDMKGSFAFDMPFPRSVALISTDVQPAGQVSGSSDRTKKNDASQPAKSPQAGQSPGTNSSGKTGGTTAGPSPSAAPVPSGNSTTTGTLQGIPGSGSLFDDVTGEILE